MNHHLALTLGMWLTAALPVAANWVPATGNLANLPSECGNLCQVFPVPNSARVIAGVAGAGLWVSRDGGAEWTKLGDGGEVAIRNRPQQILFDPANPETFWEVGIYTGPGVVKTTDGGRTFRALGGISHHDSLGIDFSDPRRATLLATGHEARQKLWQSTDGGATFRELGANLPADADLTSGCLVLDAKTYVVGCWGWRQPGGLWRTTDAGTNWTRVSDLTPARGAAILRTVKGALYCGSEQGGRVLKGTSDGAQWTSVAAPGARRVAPIELPGGVIATLGKDAILISGDEGATWKTVAPGLPIPPGNGITVGGLAYHATAKAAYVWFWDCGKVVLPDAIQRWDFVRPPNPAD